MAEKKNWIILDIIKVSEQALKEKNITNARLNAELLLANSLNTERIKLYLDFDKPLSEPELARFKTLLKRRLAHEPLQYILGTAEFYGLRFKVNNCVLIPRQETEILVEHAIDVIKQMNNTKPLVLEIGTGSGCISISIAKNCECSINAIDNSGPAINLASENAKFHNVCDKINFELLEFSKAFDLGVYDIIISNPPYIPPAVYGLLPDEIKNFEPKSALTDGIDGFSFYRNIFSIINENNITAPVLLEIGDGKRQSIENILLSFCIAKYNFYKDYINIDRVLKIN